MRRAALTLATVALLAACARFRPASRTTGTASEIAQADDLARAGSVNAARALYRKVLREQRGTPAAADALWGLGRLYVDPDGKLHDYASAQVAFGRLASEYPESWHAAEARAWHAALGELLQRQADSQRLRDDLERLKALDMEQERR